MADGDRPTINRHTAHYRANAAFRGAQRALRNLGVDPRTVPALESLRGKGHVKDWPARVGLARGPGKRFALVEQPAVPSPQPRDPAPWGGYVGEQPPYLVPVGLWLDFDRAPETEHLRRLVHGVVSTLVARPHGGHLGAWSLVPKEPRRWGVILYDPEDARRLRATEHALHLGSEPARLRVAPEVIRLRTPAPLERGRYRVTLDAVTPVVQATMGRTVYVTSPAVSTVLDALSLALQVARVSPRSTMHVASVEARTSPERVRLGGHVQAPLGWVGRLVIDCNAPAAWALQVAAQVGFGGKCAFGLGRVRVSVERVGDP